MLGIENPADDKPNFVSFLPVLTAMVFTANPSVRRISARKCVAMLSELSFPQCQDLVRPFIHMAELGSTLSMADRFLLALLTASHPNAVPTGWPPALFRFLTQQSEETSDAAVLALAILIHGFGLWQTFTRPSIHDLYAIVIKGIIHQQDPEFLDKLFSRVACSDVQTFLHVFPRLADQIIAGKESVEKSLHGMMKLYTRVAIDNEKACGGCVTCEIAHLWQKGLSSDLSLFVRDILQTHAKQLGCVQFEDDILIAGLPTGEVVGFHRMKEIFRLKNLSGRISLISLGPEMLYGVAVSIEQKVAVRFTVLGKDGGLFAKKYKVVETVQLSAFTGRAKYVVKWEDPRKFAVVEVQ
jgi:hypothetical protein